MLLLDGIHAGYGGVAVLRGVTLAVSPSSVVALLGPCGLGRGAPVGFQDFITRYAWGRYGPVPAWTAGAAR